jgi:hypothetical protein
MIPAGFVQALVTRTDLKGAAGVQELKDLFDSLFELMGKGKGKALVSTAINGKSYAWAVNMTVEEAFTAAGDALREILPIEEGGKIVQTSADFRHLRR